MLNRLSRAHVFNRNCVSFKAKESEGKVGEKTDILSLKNPLPPLLTCQSWTTGTLCCLLYLMTSLTHKALWGMQLRAPSGVIYVTSHSREISRL